ncbi:Rpn family recombination-promoting nuclease/putative transposase [Dyadobacter sp.]|uniref:Rpn family recombination-promoting nuclease/putative transposase n=1 Tax=Dyadobacter sp. TaxID=1914288 RepID=UPI003F725477
MDKHTQKHDTFLRAIMANKEIALDYFRSCIPQHIQALLDFSTLEQLPDTYVSKELQKSISDIVYTCKRAGGKGEVKISLLVEHKSYVDKYVPIQIGSYIFSGLLKQISNKESPSLIIPILLYHGRDRWEYKTLIDVFGDLEPTLRGFVPDYQYIFHNLGQISDDEIQALNNHFLAASLLAMKYSAFKKQLNALLPTIYTLINEMDKNLLNTLIVYILEGNPLGRDQFLEMITSLPPSANKESIMDTLEQFIEQGRKETTRNAVKNLIKQAVLTDEQIASAMNVTIEYVLEIRKEL